MPLDPELEALAKASPEDLERAEALREVLIVEEELERRFRSGTIAFYGWPREKLEHPNFGKPHPKQDAFHRSKAKVRAVSGGNRSGKSASGCAEDVAHARGVREWLPVDDPDYFVDVKIPNKGMVIGESFNEQVKKVLVAKILGSDDEGTAGLLPADAVVETKKNHIGVIGRIRVRVHPDAAKRAGFRCKSEEELPVSTIDFNSYEQEPKSFEGSDTDWVHFDEPPPRLIWVAVKRGLVDRNGACWLTFTPLKEAWVKREIVNRIDVFSVEMAIEDNLNYGLDQDSIDEYLKYLTDDEMETRRSGKFFHLVGAVYKSFGVIHRIDRSRIPKEIPGTWGLWMHVDPHDRVPHHAVWIAVKPGVTPVKLVIGAIKNTDAQNRIKPFGMAIRDYELGFLGIRENHPIERLIDPLADIPNPGDDEARTWIQYFQEGCGLYFRKGSKRRSAAIKIMREELGYNLEETPPIYPTLYVVSDLAGVIEQVEEYRWAENTGKRRDTNDPREEPVKQNDHYVEGIHRILLDAPSPRALPDGYEDEVEDALDARRRGATTEEGFSRGY